MRAQQNHFNQLKILEHLAPLIMLYATVSNRCGIAINVKKHILVIANLRLLFSHINLLL